ncbi:MAG: hypothetical protein PHS88_08460, partial [Candidatus Omnitrophica bacterium]|nr:hypothetical protein [Candidatus Omnitrophota bacterium]
FAPVLKKLKEKVFPPREGPPGLLERAATAVYEAGRMSLDAIYELRPIQAFYNMRHLGIYVLAVLYLEYLGLASHIVFVLSGSWALVGTTAILGVLLAPVVVPRFYRWLRSQRLESEWGVQTHVLPENPVTGPEKETGTVRSETRIVTDGFRSKPAMESLRSLIAESCGILLEQISLERIGVGALMNLLVYFKNGPSFEVVANVYRPEIEPGLRVLIVKDNAAAAAPYRHYHHAVLVLDASDGRLLARDIVSSVASPSAKKVDGLFEISSRTYVRKNGYLQRAIALLLISHNIRTWYSDTAGNLSTPAKKMYSRLQKDERLLVRLIREKSPDGSGYHARFEITAMDARSEMRNDQGAGSDGNTRAGLFREVVRWDTEYERLRTVSEARRAAVAHRLNELVQRLAPVLAREGFEGDRELEVLTGRIESVLGRLTSLSDQILLWDEQRNQCRAPLNQHGQLEADDAALNAISPETLRRMRRRLERLAGLVERPLRQVDEILGEEEGFLDQLTAIVERLESDGSGTRSETRTMSLRPRMPRLHFRLPSLDMRRALQELRGKYTVAIDMAVFEQLSPSQRQEIYKLFPVYSDGAKVRFVFSMGTDRALTPTVVTLMDLKKEHKCVELKMGAGVFRSEGRKVICVAKEGAGGISGETLKDQLQDAAGVYHVRYKAGDEDAGLVTTAIRLLDVGRDEVFRAKRYLSSIPKAWADDIRSFLSTFAFVGRSA